MVSLRSLTKPLVQFPVTCRMEGKKTGILVKAHIAKALNSKSTSTEIIVTLREPDFSRHQVLLKSPVFMPGKLEKQ